MACRLPFHFQPPYESPNPPLPLLPSNAVRGSSPLRWDYDDHHFKPHALHFWNFCPFNFHVFDFLPFFSKSFSVENRRAFFFFFKFFWLTVLINRLCVWLYSLPLQWEGFFWSLWKAKFTVASTVMLTSLSTMTSSPRSLFRLLSLHLIFFFTLQKFIYGCYLLFILAALALQLLPMLWSLSWVTLFVGTTP